jgi:hypothetical protein
MPERIRSPCSINMEYRGIKYSVVEGSESNVWRWRVLIGSPEMLRIGDASSEAAAEKQVHEVIDRAPTVEETLRSLRIKQ